MSDQVSDEILRKFLKVTAILILLVSGGCATAVYFKKADLSVVVVFHLLPFAYGGLVLLLARLKNPLPLVLTGVLSVLAGAVVFATVIFPLLPAVLLGGRSRSNIQFFLLGLLYSLPLLASGIGLLLLAYPSRPKEKP